MLFPLTLQRSITPERGLQGQEVVVVVAVGGRPLLSKEALGEIDPGNNGQIFKHLNK